MIDSILQTERERSGSNDLSNVRRERKRPDGKRKMIFFSHRAGQLGVPILGKFTYWLLPMTNRKVAQE